MVGVIPKNQSSFWLLNHSELREGGVSSSSNKPNTQWVLELLELPFPRPQPFLRGRESEQPPLGIICKDKA